jgi:DNA-binding transcriptional LysR family regulator
VRDGFDLALRASTTLDEGLVARTIARGWMVACASPGYLRARGTPKIAADLKQHTCLLGYARGEVPATHWPRADGGRIPVEGRLFSNDLTLLAGAALGGLGIALLPTLLVDGLLARGQLVRVLPDIVQADNRVSVVYPERELIPPQVRAFVDVLVAWAPKGLSRDRIDARCDERDGTAGKGSKRSKRARVSGAARPVPTS